MTPDDLEKAHADASAKYDAAYGAMERAHGTRGEYDAFLKAYDAAGAMNRAFNLLTPEQREAHNRLVRGGA